MNYYPTRETELTGTTCLIYAIFYGLALALTSSLFDYVVEVWLAKNLPWWIDVIGGIVTSSFIVPAAFITWILQLCGVV